MVDSLHSTCPGHESSPHRCRCGATITTYRGFEMTAQLKAYNLDGSRHECPPVEIADMCECVCGVQVYRLSSGKRNADGSAHVCAKRRAPQPTQTMQTNTQPAAEQARRHTITTGSV
jgi:hypothetical protein